MKERRPLLTKDTWKSFAGFFMVVMWVITIITVMQTITSCATAYKFVGTTIAVYEAFSYCCMVWGVSFVLMTIVWTMLVITMFIVGRFVGNPIQRETGTTSEGKEIIGAIKDDFNIK